LTGSVSATGLITFPEDRTECGVSLSVIYKPE